MKTKIIALFLLINIFVLSGCNSNIAVSTDLKITETVSDTMVDSIPATNEELFIYVIEKWKKNETADLYEYADSEITDVLNVNDFVYMFKSVSKIGGALNSVTDLKTETENGIDTYSFNLEFENVNADISISFKKLKICAFTRNVYFKNEFIIHHGNNIVEKYFVLENDGYKLNAVYTYVNDASIHPSTLLISGSGPCDYNETIGILTPFEDIALGLAENGINSLRIDKRTFNYASEIGTRCGIAEEYLSDYTAAIQYLKTYTDSEIYLLGHSLGGQITAELAAERNDIDGLILFNSSARHLADIACDQYSALDPSNEASYITYAQGAKKATEETAEGYYYYSATDYYWATYNKIDTQKNIMDTNIKSLIINSTYDNQTFDEDIALWKTIACTKENITFCLFDDISHLGYRIDTKDPNTEYKRVDFPKELITSFADFILEK